jgi:hypothetical protein
VAAVVVLRRLVQVKKELLKAKVGKAVVVVTSNPWLY